MARQVKTIDLPRRTELLGAIEAFFFAYRAFTAPPDRILEERGLGRVHHRILYFVGRNPGITVNELLATLGVTKQALNPPLRRLVEEGLVVSAPSEHDRRFKRLELTAAGIVLEAELSDTQLRMLQRTFGEVGSQTERSWREVMDAIAENG
jgi:DNA-binding MarR family transcriptional regulator